MPSDRKKGGKVPSFILYLHSDSMPGEWLGIGFNKAFGERLFTRSRTIWPLPPAWPYFMSPSPHPPDLVTMVILHQVHYLCISCASLPSVARLNRRCHSHVSSSEGLSLLLNLNEDPCLLLSTEHKRALLAICNFTYTCVFLSY